MSSPIRQPPKSPNTKIPTNGLFKDGIWLCNCRERLPAVKREVKKATVNQGRWFYTCQQHPDEQCRFFLWADDAQVREKHVLLANSRSEDDPRETLPQTPSKPSRTDGTGLLTPQTERKVDITPRQINSPPKSAKQRMMAEDVDEFGWDDEGDTEELSEVLQSSQATEPIMLEPNFHPELPSKAARTPERTSPGKRKLSEYTYGNYTSSSSSMATPLSSRSAASSRFLPSSAELCETPTPSRYRNVLSIASKTDLSNLAEEITTLLEKHDVVLPNRARDELVEHLNTHELKSKGIVRGRDMLRESIKKKDEEIARLRERILNHEAQRDLDRSVIDSMKQ